MKRTISSLVLLGCLLAGCGQSGPLYLPGNPSEVKTSAPPPQTQSTDQEDNGEKPDR